MKNENVCVTVIRMGAVEQMVLFTGENNEIAKQAEKKFLELCEEKKIDLSDEEKEAVLENGYVEFGRKNSNSICITWPERIYPVYPAVGKGLDPDKLLRTLRAFWNVTKDDLPPLSVIEEDKKLAKLHQQMEEKLHGQYYMDKPILKAGDKVKIRFDDSNPHLKDEIGEVVKDSQLQIPYWTEVKVKENTYMLRGNELTLVQVAPFKFKGENK